MRVDMIVPRLAPAVVLLMAWSAAAQPAPVDKTPPDVTVSIADTAAPPEWELRVPITVNVAGPAEVARVMFRLEFPSPTLAFASLKATDKLEEAGFEVSAGKPVTTGATGSIAIELVPARKEKRLLRSGVAVILVFKVSVDAEETSFTMTAKDVKAWGPAPAGAELKAVSERDALFVVSPAGLPIFACFFYMH